MSTTITVMVQLIIPEEKKRNIEDSTHPPLNQVSTLGTTPHILVTSAQLDVTPQQKKNLSNMKSTEPQDAPFYSSVLLAPKDLVKVTSTSLNIIYQMKRTSVNIPMWDVLTMPQQIELLQQELKSLRAPSQSDTLGDATSFV